MRKQMKKLIAVVLTMSIILTTLIITPIAISAASAVQALEKSDTLAIWADCSGVLTQEDIDSYNSSDFTSMVGAVSIHRRSTGSSDGYYFFLPSQADCTNLRFWYKGTSLTIDGEEVENGGTTNKLSNINEGGVQAKHTFKLGSTSYSVNCMKSGNVGTVYVDTTSGSMATVNNSSNHTASEAGTVMVVAPDGTVEYDGIMDKIQGRGNATWSAGGEKNPYNIKLHESTSLLGLGKGKKWVLLANKLDETLVRNQIGYDFSKYIGVKYQPTCKPVDLYCNQIYMGSYMLTEKVEIKSTRINVIDANENLEIANGTVDPATGIVTPADLDALNPTVATYNSNGTKNTSSTSSASATVGARRYSTGLKDPDDITGGYLYEIEISERWITENAGFCGYNRQGWVVKSADYATKAMVDYSYDLLYALGGAVYNNGTVPSTDIKTTSGAMAIGNISIGNGETITNPAPAAKYQGKHWSDLLDADSAVKYMWTQDYFKNLDASTSSTYFYKNSDKNDDKIYAGPVWDLDHALGDNGVLTSKRWGANIPNATGWYAREVRIYKWNGSAGNESASQDSQSPRSFYGALYYNNEDFRTMYNKFWYTHMLPATAILLGEDTDPTGTLKSIDEYYDDVRLTGIMNNVRTGSSTYNASSYKSTLKTWFKERRTWINSQIPQVDMSKVSVASISKQTCTGSPIEPKLELTYNGEALVEGTDFTVKYSNNVSKGTATVDITGLGYFTGEKTVGFIIDEGSLSSASIYDSAYNGDTITCNVKNDKDEDINEFINYQWYVNGVAISGATESTYTVQPEDAGKEITLVVTGDGTNITGSVTSNICQIATGERPQGFQKSIANWDYDYSVDAEALTNSDETGATYYYTATSGENSADAQLTGSVDAVGKHKIKWSGAADLYVNPENTIKSDQTPIMGTSKTDGLAWGKYPYFETTVSTLGYKDLTFSARLGGTKKGPRDWKLVYSLDGVNFDDVDGNIYTLTVNKSMELAFDDVKLPDACNNKSKVYIRAVVCSSMAIGGTSILGITSGDAAINNIKIKGESINVITDLNAPTITTTSTTGDELSMFDNDKLVLQDNNGGAKVYYTINDGDKTEYKSALSLFTADNKVGDTVTVTAWSEVGDVRSEDSVATITFDGVDINDFSYSKYSNNVSNGAVYSTGGTYDKSCKMTAYTDGKSQYVPMWNDKNKAFVVSPDDGALWSKDSGFYFETTTAGYKDVTFSAKMYTTLQGPASVNLQYSLDNTTWTDVNGTNVLDAAGELAQAYYTVDLPAECDNQRVVYFRVVTVENKTNGGNTLHKNDSKGNLYINDVVIAGNDNGEYKMPYTNKTTAYFGSSPIKYHSPSGMDMQCVVLDPEGNIILSGAYPITSDAEGINIASLPEFYNKETGYYTVSIWAGDDDDRSQINTRRYYYKGDSIVKFDYTSTKRPIQNYINEEHTVLSQTSTEGNAGTLSMLPNGKDKATFSYDDTYGAKISWTEANTFAATMKLDNPKDNGYWLISTSTKGYTNVTLNISQVSSNKGPRDWGLAYSLDGDTYTYIPNSNARAVSNDAYAAPVETYNNFALPSVLDDKENVYIKVFINGGESVDGTELETVLKGNTGINSVELSGVALPGTVDYTFRTVAYSSPDVAGSEIVPSFITVNGEQYVAPEGEVIVSLNEGDTYTVSACANAQGEIANTVTGKVKGEKTVVVPIVAHNVVADKVVNAKDYAMISRDNRFEAVREHLLSTFDNFINYAE